MSTNIILANKATLSHTPTHYSVWPLLGRLDLAFGEQPHGPVDLDLERSVVVARNLVRNAEQDAVHVRDRGDAAAQH